MSENGIKLYIDTRYLESQVSSIFTDSYDINNWKNIYILYKDSFTNCPNVDIDQLIKGEYKFTKEQLNNIAKGNVRLYLDYNQIMDLKRKEVKIYILDEQNLYSTMAKIGLQLTGLKKYPLFLYIKKNKNDNETEYILSFDNKVFLSFKDDQLEGYTYKFVHENMSNKINDNNNILQTQFDDKLIIIDILIFLYANDKYIHSCYTEGKEDLMNYYLVDKSYIDKFKEIYHYNEICNIPIIKGIKTIEDCLQNIKYFESLIEVKNIYNKINLNHLAFQIFNIYPQMKFIDYKNYLKCPSGFTIIHKEILDLLNHFSKNEIDKNYGISFGKSSLCFRWTFDINHIYIYKYNNQVFNLKCIIEPFNNNWTHIYQRYLSKMSFDNFLNENRIDQRIINNKQKIFSDDLNLLGEIYFIEDGNNISRHYRGRSAEHNIHKNNLSKKSFFKPLFNVQTINPNEMLVPQINQSLFPPYDVNKSKIIKILILLYANEKEINKLYNQGYYKIPKYFILNKDWFDKFKEIYQYNKISIILSKYAFSSFNEWLKKLPELESTNEIMTFYNNIKFDNSSLSNYDLTPYESQIDEYIYVNNFMIIHESIFNLIKYFYNCSIIPQYEITFGLKTLCLRRKDELNKIFIYQYQNDIFILSGIFELFKDYWINIFNRHLSLKSFEQYLLDKKINANIKNQKHNLISSVNVHMGYIYLTEQINQNNQSDNFIIDILILLYGNEKEIDKLYTQKNYSLKNYCLVNKDWLDKFKQIYHYNEMHNILSNKGIQTNIYCIDNLKYIESFNEIKSFSNSINNIDNYILSEFDLSPLMQDIKLNDGNFSPPINFQIINESLYNLMLKFVTNVINFKYNVTLCQPNLYLQWEKSPNVIFVYDYNKISVNLLGIIKLDGNFWGGIYQKHFIEKDFRQYLIMKNLDLNLINQKQTLISSKDEIIGYIYLVTQLAQNKVDGLFFSLYQKLINSINSLNPNICDLTNIIDIINYFQANLLINLPVFIIKNEKLRYCIDKIKKNNLNDNLLSDFDILSVVQLDASIKYSFINEEICNYFKIQNIDALPKAYLFTIKSNTNSKTYIYFLNQNCLLNVINYQENSFNIIKASQSIQVPQIINEIQNNIIPQPIIAQNNHAKGLENLGSDSYMNSTLQCLSHIPELKDYFLNDVIYKQEILTKDAPFTKSFAEVIRNLWIQTNEMTYCPLIFKNKILEKNAHFQNNKNKNARDLILLIINLIHKELNDPNDDRNEINLNDIPNELYEFRQKYYSENYSIISKLFYYESCNIFKCLNCNLTTVNYQSMNIIEFPLKEVKLYIQKKYSNEYPNITLENCFEHYERLEIFSGQNQIYCNACCQNSNESSYNKFYTCPEILSIILNHGIGFNLDIQFTFPEYISLKKYIMDKTPNTNYELISILALKSSDGVSFHYLAFCKSPMDNQWYTYNDSIVTHCISNNIINEIQQNYIPYILFYRKSKNNSITFVYNGKRGYYTFIDYNKRLYEAYNEFQNSNLWAPKNADIILLNNNGNIYLDLYKSLQENGIKNGDSILISINEY